MKTCANISIKKEPLTDDEIDDYLGFRREFSACIFTATL